MNNVLNSRMLFLIFKKIIKDNKIDSSLQKILSEGFISINNCHFLRKAYTQQSHISESDFIDKVGYESFINSLHIDDYVEHDLFEQAILFSEELIRKWKSLDNNLTLKVIVSETDFGFNVRFHVDRGSTKWIEENDLNKYKEGIIVFHSE